MRPVLLRGRFGRSGEEGGRRPFRRLSSSPPLPLLVPSAAGFTAQAADQGLCQRGVLAQPLIALGTHFRQCRQARGLEGGRRAAQSRSDQAQRARLERASPVLAQRKCPITFAQPGTDAIGPRKRGDPKPSAIRLDARQITVLQSAILILINDKRLFLLLP